MPYSSMTLGFRTHSRPSVHMIYIKVCFVGCNCKMIENRAWKFDFSKAVSERFTYVEEDLSEIAA